MRTMIEECLSRVPEQAIVVSQETIRQFCELVEERDPLYHDLRVAQRAGLEKIPLPDSYVLTLVSSISREIFTAGLADLWGTVIKGVIHTSSDIRFHGRLFCDTAYRLTVECTDLTRKKGKMGEYLAATFPHKVLDADRRLVIEDVHVFFLRTG